MTEAIILIGASLAVGAVVVIGFEAIQYFYIKRPEKKRRTDLEKEKKNQSQPIPSDEQLEEVFKDVDFAEVGPSSTNMIWLAQIASRKLDLGEMGWLEAEWTPAQTKVCEYIQSQVPPEPPPPTEFPDYWKKEIKENE